MSISENVLAAQIGPGLIGAAFTYTFAGIMFQQTVAYFARFRSDHLHHKVIVLLLQLICLMSFAGVLAIQWRTGVQIPAHPEIVIQPAIWYLNLPLALPICATTLSHMFFGMRAYVFAGRPRWLGLLLASLWLGHFVLGMTTIGIKASPSGRGTGSGFVPKKTRDWATATLATGASVDVILSGVLVLFLDRMRSGFSARTDSLLTHFLRLTVTTGGITSTLTVVTAIVWGCTADSIKYQNLEMAFVFCMPQVTGLCCVGTLLLRDRKQHGRRRTLSGSTIPSGTIPTPGSQTLVMSSKGSSKGRRSLGDQQNLEEKSIGSGDMPWAHRPSPTGPVPQAPSLSDILNEAGYSRQPSAPPGHHPVLTEKRSDSMRPPVAVSPGRQQQPHHLPTGHHRRSQSSSFVDFR